MSEKIIMDRVSLEGVQELNLSGGAAEDKQLWLRRWALENYQKVADDMRKNASIQIVDDIWYPEGYNGKTVDEDGNRLYCLCAQGSVLESAGFSYYYNFGHYGPAVALLRPEAAYYVWADSGVHLDWIPGIDPTVYIEDSEHNKKAYADARAEYGEDLTFRLWVGKVSSYDDDYIMKVPLKSGNPMHFYIAGPDCYERQRAEISLVSFNDSGVKFEDIAEMIEYAWPRMAKAEQNK